MVRSVQFTWEQRLGKVGESEINKPYMETSKRPAETNSEGNSKFAVESLTWLGKGFAVTLKNTVVYAMALLDAIMLPVEPEYWSSKTKKGKRMFF